MEAQQFKQVMLKWADGLVDSWFDPMIQPIVRSMLKANMGKADGVISAFADKDGNIVVDDILDEYEKLIPVSGYNIDAKQIFGDNLFTHGLSIKVIERSDIKLLRKLINESTGRTDGVGKGE